MDLGRSHSALEGERSFAHGRDIEKVGVHEIEPEASGGPNRPEPLVDMFVNVSAQDTTATTRTRTIDLSFVFDLGN